MKREEKQYKRLNLVEEKRGDDEKKKAAQYIAIIEVSYSQKNTISYPTLLLFHRHWK